MEQQQGGKLNMETKGNVTTRDLAEMALFLAIIIILAFTPLGYIPLGIITPTTMHIPVIVAGIVLGPKKGAITGFMFGLTSFLKASFFAPTITSFLFSPLYPGGNAWSLVICFVPRILIGIVAYYVYIGMKKVIKNSVVSMAVAGAMGSITNTILVMGMAYKFFGRQYAEALDKAYEVVLPFILSVVFGNGVPEAIVAAIITAGVCTALLKVRHNTVK